MHELEKLKGLILRSLDLHEPFHYFFDLVSANKIAHERTYEGMAEIGQNEDLLLVINVLKEKLSKRQGKPIDSLFPVLYEVPQHCFFHGSCFLDNIFAMISIVYYSDIKTGLFGIVDKKTDLYRFSFIKPAETDRNH